MGIDRADAVWEAFVNLILPMGALRERRSRYGDKPAIYVGSREIAHREAPGQIDLRITHRAWTRIRADYVNDPSVTARPGRRDWIELSVPSTADVARLAPLISKAVAAND